MTMALQYNISEIGELSPEGVFEYDLKAQVFTYINKPFAEIFKTSYAEIKENPRLVVPLFHSEDAHYLQHCYARLMTERTIETEFRLQFPDRSVMHICLDAYLVKDTTLMTGFLKDITKNKQHEDYIINYGAKKDTLLDMLTHNLSGPLHLSKDIIRWMQQTYADENSGEISKQLQYIQDNTQQCIDIINDFLREEHLESEKIYVRKTRFDVLERIVVTLDKLIATNKNKQFRLITDLENLNITTDSVKFFQIIHNLVSNSIKFTPDHAQIDIIVEEHEDCFQVHVKDNGIGVPVALQPRLFDKRTSAGREGLNNEASTGLGLSIVKALVELLDGKVWFTSEENKGSVFSIELPKE
ncbi:MAG: PAS domain-containing sensor histidine kinase [Chitinophagaceae bacterium]|nr:MAG: PAS domain-containing sensor histidine kinase [Chitinophagaceae bacterium]